MRRRRLLLVVGLVALLFAALILASRPGVMVMNILNAVLIAGGAAVVYSLVCWGAEKAWPRLAERYSLLSRIGNRCGRARQRLRRLFNPELHGPDDG